MTYPHDFIILKSMPQVRSVSTPQAFSPYVDLFSEWLSTRLISKLLMIRVTLHASTAGRNSGVSCGHFIPVLQQCGRRLVFVGRGRIVALSLTLAFAGCT